MTLSHQVYWYLFTEVSGHIHMSHQIYFVKFRMSQQWHSCWSWLGIVALHVYAGSWKYLCIIHSVLLCSYAALGQQPKPKFQTCPLT